MLNRRLNLALAFSSALLLAGCASSPEYTDFVEIGNNTYTISASSESTDNGGIVRVELIKQAQEFCADKDLKFLCSSLASMTATTTRAPQPPLTSSVTHLRQLRPISLRSRLPEMKSPQPKFLRS